MESLGGRNQHWNEKRYHAIYFQILIKTLEKILFLNSEKNSALGLMNCTIPKLGDFVKFFVTKSGKNYP